MPVARLLSWCPLFGWCAKANQEEHLPCFCRGGGVHYQKKTRPFMFIIKPGPYDRSPARCFKNPKGGCLHPFLARGLSLNLHRGIWHHHGWQPNTTCHETLCPHLGANFKGGPFGGHSARDSCPLIAFEEAMPTIKRRPNLLVVGTIQH